MGLNTTAPPVICEIDGTEYLVVCQEAGDVHLRLPDWSEAPGWPVDVGSPVLQAIASESMNSIFLLLENNDFYRIGLDGQVHSPSPVSFALPLAGGCVFPHEEFPGLVLVTADGSLRRVNPGGGTLFGWPVHPGSEDITLPMAADFDRDGGVEIAVVSGGELWVYGEDASLEPGFL